MFHWYYKDIYSIWRASTHVSNSRFRWHMYIVWPVSCDNGHVMVFPDNLSIAVIVKDNLRLRDTITYAYPGEVAEIVSKQHTFWHKKTWSQSCPPNPDELNENYMKLLDSLVTFLINSFMGDTGWILLVESVGQYCVYAIIGAESFQLNIYYFAVESNLWLEMLRSSN